MDEIGWHVLSEISQTEKYKYWIYHLYVESKKKMQQPNDYNKKEADTQIWRMN